MPFSIYTYSLCRNAHSCCMTSGINAKVQIKYDNSQRQPLYKRFILLFQIKVLIFAQYYSIMAIIMDMEDSPDIFQYSSDKSIHVLVNVIQFSTVIIRMNIFFYFFGFLLNLHCTLSIR